MRDMAIEVGRALCAGALQSGLSGLRCYADGFLLSLGWLAGALLLVAVVIAGKALRGRGT